MANVVGCVKRGYCSCGPGNDCSWPLSYGLCGEWLCSSVSLSAGT